MGGKAEKVGGTEPARKTKGKKVQIRVAIETRQTLLTLSGARGDKDIDVTVEYLLSLAPETPQVRQIIRETMKRKERHSS